MTTNSYVAKVIQEIIKKIKTVSDVTKYMGNRIYPAYISTIQDVTYPAISINVLPSEGKSIDDAGMQTIDMDIDFWFKSGIDANSHTWDNVMECKQAVLNELHNNGGWDNIVGINVLMMDSISDGPQAFEQDTKIMRYQLRFRTRGTLQ